MFLYFKIIRAILAKDFYLHNFIRIVTFIKEKISFHGGRCKECSRLYVWSQNIVLIFVSFYFAGSKGEDGYS